MKTGISRRAAGNDNDLNYANVYLTFVPLEDATFTFTQRGTGSLYYSIDGGAWTAATSGTATPTVQVGSSIQWKGNLVQKTNASAEIDNGIGTFSASGNYNAIGNPISLLENDTFVGAKRLSGNRHFVSLFNGDTHLVNAENISLCALSVGQRCYQAMFYGCTSLTTPPKVLEFTDMNSYCCNQMFYGCSSLTKASEFRAQTLATHCYRDMYYGCSSLTTAPDLLAETLVGYCYFQMFRGCSSLNYIKMMATSVSASNALGQWVNGVSSSGEFVKDANTTIQSGNSGIPNGWTVTNI